MFHKLARYFQIQLRICNGLMLTPYEWPTESPFPIVHRSRFRWRMYQLSLLAEWVYVIITTTYFVSTHKYNSMGSKMLGAVFLDCFFVTLSMRSVIFAKEEEALNMICSFLEFERQNPEGMCSIIKTSLLPQHINKLILLLVKLAKTEKADIMGRTLITLGILTSFGLPGLMVTILLVDPCKPPHLGYMFFKTIEDCRTPAMIERFVMLFFDWFMWINSIAPACFYVFNFMFMGLRCMDHYIALIAK